MKNCNIGGQALIEGILMRKDNDYAIAVRRSDKEIVTKIDQVRSGGVKEVLKKIPIVRGVVNFLSSISLGYEALSYSASIYEEQDEVKAETRTQEEKKQGSGENLIKEKQKKEAEDKKANGISSAGMAFTMVISIALSVSLFIVLPYVLANILGHFGCSELMIAIAEGGIRLVIFFAYMILMSMIKDIRRVLMYHGAEHKCINCIEHELPLTVENVMKSSRFHKRCGTGFLFYIIIISIILFMFIKVDLILLRVLIRLLLVPVIAGIAYELLKITGKKDNTFLRFISCPALFFQRFTTREPSPDMVEVAIEAVRSVYNPEESEHVVV